MNFNKSGICRECDASQVIIFIAVYIIKIVVRDLDAGTGSDMETSAKSGEFESTKFDVLGLNDFSREPFRVVGRVRVDDGSRLCPENNWVFWRAR